MGTYLHEIHADIKHGYYWTVVAPRAYASINHHDDADPARRSIPRHSPSLGSGIPFRPRGSGGPGGVALTWKNGTEIPNSVRVRRNGVEIAAAAPVDPPSFVDASAPLGVNSYELQFTMPGDPCPPLILRHNGGITGLKGQQRNNGIKLTWSNNRSYTGIMIKRSGTVIAASLPGTATSYTDISPPTGSATYIVEPVDAGSTPAQVQVTISAAPTSGAVIYEPFDMTAGTTISDKQGGIGLDGHWNASDLNEVAIGSLSFGTQAVGPLDHFAISAITSPQNVGTPINGITLTAQDASNNPVTTFTGTVNFGGSGGFTGTSPSFTAGVLTGVSVTPTTAGGNLTFTVTDSVSGKTGSTVITTIQTPYETWSGGALFDEDSNGDGVDNGIAWVLGATDKNTSTRGLLPTFNNTSDPNYFIFTYPRLDTAVSAGTGIAVRYCSDLGGWATANHDGTNIITTTANDFFGTSPGIDKVEVKIKKTLAVGGKLFARLVATP